MLRRLILAGVIALGVPAAVVAGAAYWFFARDGFRTALESQVSAWLGHPVRIRAARAQAFPRLAVQLEDIRVGDPVQLALADVELASDLRPLLAGRIENADVRVSDTEIDMPLRFGLPESSAPTQDAAGAPVQLVSVRSIALRNVRLRSRGREIAVSADSSFDRSALALERFSAASGGTTLEAEGVVRLAPRIDARLKATANRLDVDELLALADAFRPSAGSGGAGGKRPPARIAATIAADRATAAGLEMRAFTTELTLDGDAVALSPLQFSLFGGRYEGTMKAHLATPLTATLASRVIDVDVAQLAAFGGSPDTITGRLSADATMTGSGADMAQLLRGLRGTGTAAIVDGTIRRLNLIRTVVLFFGRPAPDAGEATDRFQRIESQASLSNRVLRAETLALRSDDADMVGEGTLSLDTDALDGRVDLLLSEKLSAQAGTDLYRYTREGNRVVLPASIGGTLSAPRLTIDVGAAAKRGLRNEAERRLKGLFDRFGR
jgi:hypothetical protein